MLGITIRQAPRPQGRITHRLDYSRTAFPADVLGGLRDRASFKNATREILDRDVQSKMTIEESGRYKRTKRPIPVPYRSAFDYHLDGTIPMKDAGYVMCVSLGTG